MPIGSCSVPGLQCSWRVDESSCDVEFGWEAAAKVGAYLEGELQVQLVIEERS